MRKQLICRECGSEFVFSEEERQFLLGKGFHHEPKACPNCRLFLRQWRDSKQGILSALTTVNCDNCGVETKVPFKPVGHKPVFCMSCLHKQNRPDSTRMNEQDPTQH